MKLPLVLFLGSASLLAQSSIVFPSSHTNIPNGATSIGWFPYSSGISRMQIVYEDWDLTLPANTPITRIGFRQDGSQTSPQRLVNMEVRMGITNATATNLGTNFDGNFLGGSTVVFAQGIYTLPALTSATANAPVWLNLTTPYNYPGGNLLVEFRVFGNNNGNQAFNYPFDQALFVSPVTAGVQGCQHSGGQRPVLTSQPTQIGANWSISVSTAPANTAAVLCVAPGQTMVAPYSLQFLGLDPSCQGQLPASFLTLSGTTGSSGFAYWTIAVPYNLAFNNYVMTSQVVALDFFVPGSLVVSNADQVQFGVTPASSILYSQGSPSATTGGVYPNYGVVTLFN